ncbi:MAG: cobalamin biosynthesis protein P47K [Planctomycetes bacterium]|nr:cobalamin biosynthesis protein P47K [Planctomycetota bacterium]
MSVRFVMIGGFLGAGKTTTVGRLARHYMARGKRVGIVTNDQAHDLVDTNSLRAQGLTVEEVPGACFCCRFDDLVGRVGALEGAERPDVILAEPVGSCTDLVATVIQPLKDLYAGRFAVAPYPVLFKPSHGLRILRNQTAGGFSPKAAYIFKKQLEEADAIVINRIDELDPSRVEELARLVGEQFPGTPVLRTSAVTGAGFDALAELLDQDGAFGRKVLDIDYDTYAEGEAELGWLNATARLTAPAPFDLDTLLSAILADLATACRALGGEVAHLKLIGMDDASAFAVGNLVSSDTAPVLSLPSGLKPRAADLIVNARVATDPAALEAEVKRVVAARAAAVGATAEFRTSQSLRPGRPVPTHRYTKGVAP